MPIWGKANIPVDRLELSFDLRLVTRDHIETAVRDGIPFAIKMADGNEYQVTDSYQVALGRAHVVYVDKKDLPHVLPLLTMTGISYLKASG